MSRVRSLENELKSLGENNVSQINSFNKTIEEVRFFLYQILLPHQFLQMKKKLSENEKIINDLEHSLVREMRTCSF